MPLDSLGKQHSRNVDGTCYPKKGEGTKTSSQQLGLKTSSQQLGLGSSKPTTYSTIAIRVQEH